MCRGQETTLAVIFTSILRRTSLSFPSGDTRLAVPCLSGKEVSYFCLLSSFRSTEIIEVGITHLVFFVLRIYFIFIYLCVSLCMTVQVPMRPEEGIRSSGTKVPGSCELGTEL